MSWKDDLAAFEDRIGHRFGNRNLLEEALTHSSFQSAGGRNNQRFEFLGDRVLGLATAEVLLELDRQADEGALAPRLNAMVRKEMCAEIASEIGLGQVMRIGKSETKTGGRRKTALLGDAMEAVIAAVYLDSGYGPARDLIRRLWGKRFSDARSAGPDAKTALQEFAQARGQATPEYRELSRKGPDHAPIFEIEVALDDGRRATASERSKRAAQQEAAAKLLAIVEAEA